MSELVLVVGIRIKPEHVEKFMAEILANAVPLLAARERAFMRRAG